MSLIKEKKSLRKKAKKIRAYVSRTYPNYSETICQRLQTLLQARNPSTVTSYDPFGSEIDLLPLNEWLANTYTLLLPRITTPTTAGESVMEFVEVKDLGDENFALSSFGIREPVGKASTVSVDVVLVPGLQFDRRGYRLGYGGGYYDRYLKKLRENQEVAPYCIGVTYNDLLVDLLPTNTYDLPVNHIITEDEIVVVSM